MSRAKRENLTKKDILKKIQSETGLSYKFIDQLTEDFISIFKKIIKEKGINIKNFGTFTTTKKKKEWVEIQKIKLTIKLMRGKQFVLSHQKKLMQI